MSERPHDPIPSHDTQPGESFGRVVITAEALEMIFGHGNEIHVQIMQRPPAGRRDRRRGSGR